MIPQSAIYNIAFFDVLGFSARLRSRGIAAIAEQYAQLVSVVDRQNKLAEEIAGIGFEESAYWTAEGDIVALQYCQAAYASDSFVVWAHSYFPAARALPERERDLRARDAASGWEYAPVPCDIFLTLCSELMCRGLECGLPLRGAVARGVAIMDRGASFYLGEPLVEAATLEKAQEAISLGLCSSFMSQHVPARFTVAFGEHMRMQSNVQWSGRVLAWPRYWHSSRRSSCRDVLRRLADGSGDAIQKYTNTIQIHDRCEQDGLVQLPRGVRGEYPQFSRPEVTVHVKAARKVHQL